MKHLPYLPRRARWAAPAAIIAAAGAVLTVRSTAQLLAAVTGNASHPR